MGTEEPKKTESGEPNKTESGEPNKTESGEPNKTESGEPKKTESGQLIEKPEVTDEHKEKAKEMAKAYDDDALQNTTLPGSGGTVSGTAVSDWVDEKDKGHIETTAEEGKVEYRNTDEFRKIQES
jgi:hypothetical protein